MSRRNPGGPRSGNFVGVDAPIAHRDTKPLCEYCRRDAVLHGVERRVLGCPGCKVLESQTREVRMTQENADAETEHMKVESDDRSAAHQALDRWLDECEHEADDTFASGHSGYIGRIKLCAFVSDDGVALRIERSFTRAL